MCLLRASWVLTGCSTVSPRVHPLLFLSPTFVSWALPPALPFFYAPISISILTLCRQTLPFPFCMPTAFPKPLGLHSPLLSIFPYLHHHRQKQLGWVRLELQGA